MISIATIIHFSSNEHRFIDHAICQAQQFSKQVIITVADCLFSGEPENRAYLTMLYARYPGCLFVEFEYAERLNRRNDPHFWLNVARWLGVQHCEEDIDFVVLVDADEVIDGHRFKRWVRKEKWNTIDSVEFLSYWYFRNAQFQAKQNEVAGWMVRRALLRPRNMFSQSERHALVLGRSLRNFVFDGEPLVHHFSWVRTKTEMIRKVSSWGHKEDKEWLPLVEKEFQAPFSGTDFVHGYTFNTVRPFVDIDMKVELPSSVSQDKKAFNHVRYLPLERVKEAAKKGRWYYRLF